MQIPEFIILAILSIAICFFGYRLKRVAFSVVWFIIGFDLATMFMPWLAPKISYLDPIFIDIIPLAVGLLCALIGVSIERVCLALLGFGVSLLFYFSLVDAGAVQASAFGFGLAIVIGCIIAASSVKAAKYGIIIISAIVGAQQLSGILASLLPQIIYGQFVTLSFLIIAAAGIIVQLKTARI